MEMRDIAGYEGLYAITEDGQVWSYRSNRFLSLINNGHGYLYVNLWKNDKIKKFKVHILVAKAFLPPPEEGQTDVGHLDDNRQNNHVSNLKWMTRAENLNTEHFKKATKIKIFSKVRCVETGEIFSSQAEAGRSKNIHRYGINNVLNGKQKTAGGYHWERVFDATV